jgi:hypothetical protein
MHVSKSQSFFPIWIIFVIMYYIWETSRNKLRKHSFQKKFWPFTVQMNLQILILQPRISIVFFSITSENNFGNKRPLAILSLKKTLKLSIELLHRQGNVRSPFESNDRNEIILWSLVTLYGMREIQVQGSSDSIVVEFLYKK